MGITKQGLAERMKYAENEEMKRRAINDRNRNSLLSPVTSRALLAII